MFSTVYFCFRNYRNTGAVFVSKNTVPFSFPIKKCESKSDGVFRRRFRRFSSLISTARRPCCRSLSITLSLGPSSSPPPLAAAPVHSCFENSSRSSDAAVLGSWAAAPASLLARQSHPPLFPSCAAPLALRISHPFRNPCRS